MNGMAPEIQKVTDRMFLHEELASGIFNDTPYRILQPIPPAGLVVEIGTGQEREKYFFPMARVVTQTFAFHEEG